MKIVIDIHEKDYQSIKNGHIPFSVLDVLMNGTPFPEQQPCEDYISREAVMKCFKKLQSYMATRLWNYEQELKELPSVTPSYNSINTELKLYEDYISRQKLLSRIDAERKHLLDIKMDGAEHIIVHHARRIIEDMPSVTLRAESEDEE